MNFTFTCPNCCRPLIFTERSYVCSAGHRFDCAKSGYVNLLRPDQKNAKLPGDNKEMVRARRSFLARGYYEPLAKRLAEALAEALPANACLLDAGCGEGYYTDCVQTTLPGAALLGVDISKFAVDYAARQNKNIGYAVGSIFHLPLADRSCDGVMTLFAPYCGEEFQRVLKPNGVLALVIPGTQHLLGLKQAIYDHPYENEVKDYALEGFSFVRTLSVEQEITLTPQEDIQNLFTMTPYYYKTSAEDAARLAALSSLTTPISFEILLYRLAD